MHYILRRKTNSWTVTQAHVAMWRQLPGLAEHMESACAAANVATVHPHAMQLTSCLWIMVMIEAVCAVMVWWATGAAVTPVPPSEDRTRRDHQISSVGWRRLCGVWADERLLLNMRNAPADSLTSALNLDSGAANKDVHVPLSQHRPWYSHVIQD